MVAVAFDFRFMGGSMGSVVGERFLKAATLALEENIPLVCFSASGGARMQEALYSLMQMSKTSAVLAKLAKNKVPYISVLTDPTMGGVSASFAMLGDVHIAEPKALIGFAGPRVIEQTVGEKLPEGFQRSEFLLEHGAIDMIVNRCDLPDRIASIVLMLQKNRRLIKLQHVNQWLIKNRLMMLRMKLWCNNLGCNGFRCSCLKYHGLAFAVLCDLITLTIG